MRILKTTFCVLALIILAPIAFLFFPILEVLDDNQS